MMEKGNLMRYKQIARRLADGILRDMAPGERLPGVRELARSENISLVTAKNVYRYLFEQGLVVSRQGAGTFVAHGMSGGVIDMAVIRPPGNLMLWVSPHLRLTIEGLNTYDPPQGYEPLREQAGKWLMSSGIDSIPMVTSGAQQALFLLGLSLLRKGDAVAVEDPGYMGAARIFESLGAEVVSVPCIASREDLDRIGSLDIRLLYTMPQGHIPTGRSMPGYLRDDLIAMASDKDFFIIEDDPLSDVVGITPLKARDTRERVIYIKSLSNILGPGLRMGFAVFPDSMQSSILDLKEINDLSLSGILQRSLLTVFTSSRLSGHIERLRHELAQRSAYLAQNTPWEAGGPCVWIRTPIPSRICRDRLLEHGVRITPGDIYGSRWSHYIRLSVLTPTLPDFKRGVGIVQEFLNGVKGPELTEF